MSKYKYNKDYFEKIDTSDKAYWLGFLYADGCINRYYKNDKLKSMTLELGLSYKDKEHLEKFKQCLDTNIPIFEKINKLNGQEYKSVRIQLNNTKICNLSGGESKKFFLSLVLSSPNALLLLDEPTNSLDEHSKQILIQELKIRSGLTIIVTHDSFFDNQCDCLAIIESGEIRFEKR